ncbi:serine-threonine protein kinase [Streptomyces sp. H10-C2]|uniref:serine-threonine protein kinase n=1 Tax=unclassified Streptomyces TaxID=2593676 RepID=UPI0024BB06DF|nr:MULTISPECIES: serine-threonine protein kinase [unclassified Streptomyces]MDJ0344548.1 serine-threonine protein kinase [Streptomyces sp. PH10-H1]MDJ0371043.1 serine-threonine protein kinase [Streptomyces sp. H10-C2]
MAAMSVQPYWELTFDADGDVDPRQRDQLLAQVTEARITDLVMFAHGWNNDRSMATWLYDRFFAPFPGLLGPAPGTSLGYVGVLWPAMRFSDEPIPDFTHSAVLTSLTALDGHDAQDAPDTPVALPADRIVLSPETCLALTAAFPGHAATVGRLAEMLRERPGSAEAFGEFARLVRDLVGLPAGSPAAAFGADAANGAPEAEPAILGDDPVALCETLTAALQETGVDLGPEEPEFLGGLGKRLWNGAHELLRQASYFAMKRRAGTIGQLGLGPMLGRLSQTAGPVRVHLVGHSFGGRLVSFALLGLPAGVRNVKSVTLLQGAFSHYAFARQLPGETEYGGALRDVENRVDGPVVSCYSSHDTALGVIYPLASRLSGDATSFLGLGDRWGAIGHDGIQAVDGTRTATLADAREGRFPANGCVSVDASAVVCSGSPPAGAHSDICHEELAQVVLAAGRIAH